MYLIVIDANDEYVYLCDGSTRRIENPKKKKIKHIEITEFFSDVIAEKIKNKNKISNQDIRRALREILKKK